MTRGLYKSTPHRVRNTAKRSRYSFPYFYDPGWKAEIKELDIKVTP
jgi:isopenicillin N synthase-like dioxygenase